MPLTRYMTTKAYYMSTPYRSPTSGLLSSGIHVVMIEKQPELSFQMRKSSSHLLSLAFDPIPWCLLQGGESNNWSFSQEPLRYFRVVGSSGMKYVCSIYLAFELLISFSIHTRWIQINKKYNKIEKWITHPIVLDHEQGELGTEEYP